MEAAGSLQNDAKSDKAAKFYEQALLLVDCCKIPEAIKLLEKAIELNPDSEIYKETLAFFQMNTECYTDHLAKDNQGSSYASVTRTKSDASYKKEKSTPEWNVKKTKAKENLTAKMPWTPDVSSSYYSDPYEQATIENPWASFVNSSYRRKKPDRSPIDGLSEIELPNGSKVESPLSNENSFSSMLKTPISSHVISSHETIDDDSGSSGHEHENHADTSANCYGYKNGAYPEGVKEDHDENLEKTFLEELCKARETALDDWAKYYEMLYSGLSKEGVPSTQSDTLGQKVHVPTTQYSDSLDDVDESSDVRHKKDQSNSDKPMSRSNSNVCSKCGHFNGIGNPPPSPSKNRIHFVNGACVSSSNVSYCTCNKQGKDNSEQQSTRSQLSSSQQEFYRNLQSYFGNGKVKGRKTTTDESSSKGSSDDLDLHTMTCNSCDTNISANATKKPSNVTSQNVMESAEDGSVKSENRTFKEHVRHETKNESTFTEGGKKDKKSHNEERFQQTSFKPKSKVDEKVRSRPKASKAEHVKNTKEGASRSDSHRQARAKVGVKSRVSHKVKAEDPAKTVPGTDVKERPSKHSPTAEKAEANIDFSKLFYSVYCTGLSLLSKSGQAFKSIIYYVLLLMMLLVGFVLYCAWFACCWSCRKVLQYIPAERLLVYIRSKGSSLYEWFRKCREKRKSSAGGQTYDLPKNGDAAVMHMLQNKDSDPYSVLGVPRDATDDDIRKQYRRLAVLIHPDKNTHPQADEAFKTLANAFDILSDPVKRSNFDTEEAWKRRAEDRDAHYGRGPTSPEQFFADLGRKMQEMQNYLHCNACDGKHRRYSTDRFILTARFCGRCNTRHSAKEGDLWAESSFLGYKLHFYACMEGEVFDVTEWAACQGIGSYRVEPNPHTVHLKLKTRQSNPSGFNSRAEEKDFENFMRAFFGQPPDRERYHGTSKPQKRRRKRKH